MTVELCSSEIIFLSPTREEHPRSASSQGLAPVEESKLVPFYFGISLSVAILTSVAETKIQIEDKHLIDNANDSKDNFAKTRIPLTNEALRTKV